MRTGCALLLLLPLLCAGLLGMWASADELTPELPAATLRGLVTTIANEEAGEPSTDDPADLRQGRGVPKIPDLELRASHKVEVRCAGVETFLVHETAALKDLGETTDKVWLLAFRQAETADGRGGRFPPQFIRINAVVIAGDVAFQPPPVPAELGTLVTWRSGKLHSNGGVRFSFSEGGGQPVNVQTGPDRLAIRLRRGTADDVPKRRDLLWVRGTLDQQSKTAILHARDIVRLAPAIGAKEQEFVLGPDVWPARPGRSGR